MKLVIAIFLYIVTNSLFAQFAQPFKWSVESSDDKLTVSVDIPTKHYLYADGRTVVDVSQDGKVLTATTSPKLVNHTDEFGSGLIIESGLRSWIYSIDPKLIYKVSVNFQGCKSKTKDSPAVCFMPSSDSFTINDKIYSKNKIPPNDKKNNLVKIDDKDNSLDLLLDQFKVINSGGGHLNADKFLSFLDENTYKNSKTSSLFSNSTTIGMIILVLLGGLALNLTPCVLPMIPINLAIIGAGKDDGKRQGFLKGAVYGFGIAIAYGGLGLITVLSGARFGTLNSASWFNFLIAAIFIVLALAMFDVLTIDLTKYSNRIGVTGFKKGAFIPIFVMGSVAALLAGACVAPVVIAVLLHSTTLYSEGSIAGLILPFVLGVGMALPWPFAGAGFSLLPKPGMWMVRVKQGMGVFIILFAAYYAYLGITLLKFDKVSASSDSFTMLREGLLRAKDENKPVFIDFWATWCKNCTQMEHSTFIDPKVVKKLNEFIVIKFQAEQPNDPKIKKVLDRYKLIGLPGYVILSYKKEGDAL